MSNQHITPIIYMGKNKDGKHVYGHVADISRNDGSEYTGDIKIASNKLFNNDRIGCMHYMTLENDTVNFNKSSDIIGYWKNDKDIAKWMVKSRAAETYIKMLKDGKKGGYEELLAPIRDAYRDASYKERTIILAEVIRIITN